MSENDKPDTKHCTEPKCSDLDLKEIFKRLELKEESIPQIPGEELKEYEKIQIIKRQPIEDARKTAKRAAKKAYDDKELEVKLTLVTAQKVFETAEEKHKSDTQKEINRADEKIASYYDEYISSLITESNSIPSMKKCGSYEELPDYIRAVPATNFHKKVAELKVEYQTNINAINKTFFEATKAWDLAQETYNYDICVAKAQKEKADYEADLAWRTSLKTEVGTACQ